MKTHPPFIILDFETTGLDPLKSEIIEVAAIKIVDRKIEAKFVRLVRPTNLIPSIITHITGITNEMVSDAPEWQDIAASFSEFLGDLPLVAHNAPMEERFLNEKLSKTRGGEAFHVEDSIELFSIILPSHPSYSLEAARTLLNRTSDEAHRAYNDCEDVFELIRYLEKLLARNEPPAISLQTAQLNSALTFLLKNDHYLSPWWWDWILPTERLDTSSAQWGTWLSHPSLGDLKDFRKSDDSDNDDDSNPGLLNSESKSKTPSWLGAAEEAFQPRGTVIAEGEKEAREYQYRPQQWEMTKLVAQAIHQNKRLAVEAPTGTGKSLAYLIPGFLNAREKNTKLVVSTHSKSLQDQLLEKDVPLARKLLKDSPTSPSLRATSVKGQDNYLCLRKLSELLDSQGPDSTLQERLSLAFYVSTAIQGKPAEVGFVSMFLKSQNPWIGEHHDWIRSHHTTTIGPSCPFYDSCHFFDSARLAHQSQVIIANHSLVFHWPAHLPKIRNLVFDEAHHLEDQLTRVFTQTTLEESLTEWLSRMTQKRTSRHINDLKRLGKLLDTLTLNFPRPGTFSDLMETATENLSSALYSLQTSVPTLFSRNANSEAHFQSAPFGSLEEPNLKGLRDPLESLILAEKEISELLTSALAATEGMHFNTQVDLLKTVAMRFEEIADGIRGLGKALSTKDTNALKTIHWNPAERTWKITVEPIDVSALTSEIIDPIPALFFTSATLSSGAVPDFLFKRIGLNLSAPVTVLASPYQIETQAKLFIPNDIPIPGSPMHLEALTRFTQSAAMSLGGRTLVLICSNRRLTQCAEALRVALEPHGISVFDSVSDRKAAEQFRANPRSVLVGGERYGEGLDLPGSQLSLVIVEKINEAMTRGPLAEARKSRTKFSLFDYDFPLRLIWLKQRVGRLIRSSTDRGAIVVFDSRYYQWGASSRAIVQKALAPMPVQTAQCEQILSVLEQEGY